jgi:hypothetical protein
MPIFEVNAQITMRGDATLLITADTAEEALKLVEDEQLGAIDWDSWLDLAHMTVNVTELPLEIEAARQKRIAAGEELACRSCGCSESKACPGGCHWAKPGLCSACATKGAN